MPKEFQTLLADVPFKVGNFALQLSNKSIELVRTKLAELQAKSFQDQDEVLIR
jgi:hypothetical protein